jgi:propionyl-CoA synthetase
MFACLQCTKPTPGYQVEVVDPETTAPLPANHEGDIVIKLPLPPGTLPYLYNARQGYIDKYLTRHPGYYDTGDFGMFNDDGYVHVLSRTDDTINVAGHRISTGSIEEVLASHELVAECAVVGVHDNLKGQLPFGFVVLNKKSDDGKVISNAQIAKELVKLVRHDIGPVAAYKNTLVVPALPKTRSGKIIRRALAGIMDHYGDLSTIPIPATIENADVLQQVADVAIEWLDEHKP